MPSCSTEEVIQLDNPQTRRKLFILAASIDSVLSGIILLIYFGLLPVDISGWGIPRWVVGLIGGVWFVIAIGVLAWQVARTDISE